MKIPDIVPLLLILLLFIAIGCVIYYLHKQGKPEIVTDESKGKIEKLIGVVEDYKKVVSSLENEFRGKIIKQSELIAKIYNNPEEYTLLPPDGEIIFILNMLAVMPGRRLEKSTLNKAYLKQFPDKGQGGFNIVVSKLEGHELIREENGGDIWAF